MTTDQWGLVPDSVVRDGPRLLAWLADRGIRPPLLLDLEVERSRRGMTKRPRIRPVRPVLPMPTAAEHTTREALRRGLPVMRVIAGRPTLSRPREEN